VFVGETLYFVDYGLTLPANFGSLN
jgi:hypothetical protein